MLKQKNQTAPGYISSILTAQKTKKRKNKKKKKKKNPKKWNFESRIKKVTADEKIYIDWDAPVLDSPIRPTRQSWTIYGNPEETPRRKAKQMSPESQKQSTLLESSKLNQNLAK